MKVDCMMRGKSPQEIIRSEFVNLIAVLTFLLLMVAPPVRAAEEKTAPSQGEEAAPVVVQPEEPAETEKVFGVPMETEVATRTEADVLAGYRFLGIDGYGGRAAEYQYLRSNPVLGAQFNSLGKDLKLALDGAFLNDRDYNGNLLIDHKGEYRFHLRTESLFHNLDNLTLVAPSPIAVSGNDSTALFGIKVEQDLARFRYKLHGYPVHVNFGYWRIAKDGDAQLRFADHAFAGAPNTLYSKSRRIDRETHEGNIGFDSHLGPVDLIYNFTIREFNDHVATPRDFFVARPTRTEGVQEHNEDPESRFYAHTVKLHTSLTGGIVGAASYSYGRRENRGSLADIRGADSTRDTLHNVAGDFTFTPCKEFSLALRYRRQEIDRDNPAAITSAFASPSTLSVRPALDTQKDILSATLSYRPANLLSVSGEYKGEFLHRDNVTNGAAALNWGGVPENSETHRGTVAVVSRPVKGLRLKARYSYSAVSHPAYDNAFDEKHEGEFLANYNSLNRWGVTANCRIAREGNDRIPRSTYLFSRDKDTNNATANLWFVPVNKLTISGSYGLLRSKVNQGVLFDGAGTNVPTDFTSQGQIYAVNAVYYFDERLDLSIALQQVRSYSEFDPESNVFSGTQDTSGIKEISRFKTVESSLSARADYHMTRNFTCSVDYNFRDYDEKNGSLFDGSVNSVTLLLAAKW